MIKVNEYVRTKDRVIGKAIKVLSNRVFLDNLGYAVLIKDIVKHSKQLIDLIEVGDYVNGHKIEEIWEDAEHYRLAGCDYMFEITEDDIKSIVTHEMFESIEYKVEEGK